MKKLFKNFTICFLTFLFFSNCSFAQSNLENSTLWEISGKGLEKPSYLFGTMHLMCEQDFSISDKAKAAFEKSDKLALELDMDDPSELANMQKLMILKEPLSKSLSSEDYKKLSDLLKDKFNLEIKQLDNFSLMAILSVVIMKAMECPPKAYEMEFMQMASQRKMELIGMETMEQQMKAFNDAYTSSEIIEQFSQYDKSYLGQMSKVYQQENLNDLYKMTTSSNFMSETELALMLDNRNIHWVEKIPALISNQSVFIAVGAAHLPGKNGVINLLKNAGYTLKPIIK